MLALTRRGWGYLALAFALWIGSRLLGLHDVWNLGVLLASFVVVSAIGVLLTAALGRISASVHVSDPTPSLGDDVVVSTHLAHRLPWRIRVRARWRLADAVIERTTSAPPRRGSDLSIDWTPPRRGPVRASLRSLTLLGPLGLVRLGLRRKDGAQLLVLPPTLRRLERPSGIRLQGGSQTPLRNVPTPENGEPAGALRDYRSGDAMRQVHWKQSARQGQLLVNLPEPQRLSERSLFLETDAAAYPDAEAFELAVAVAGTVGCEMLALNDVLRLNLGRQGTAVLHSESELLRLLAHIERYESGAQNSRVPDLPGIHWETAKGVGQGIGQDAVVVTAKVTPELKDELEHAPLSNGTLYVHGGIEAPNIAGEWDVLHVSPALMPRLPSPPREEGEDFRETTRTQLVLGGLALVGLWVLSLHGLTHVLEGGSWFPRAIILAGIATLVACLSRVLWTRLRSAAAMAGAFASLCVLLWWSYDARRLEGWWSQASARFASIRDDILVNSAPMEVSGAMEDVVLLVVILGALVGALLLFGMDAFLLAGAVPAAVLLVPPIVLGESASEIVIVAVGALLSLLVWAGSPLRTLGGAIAAVTALALAAAAVALTPAMRDRVWNQSIVRPPVSATVPDVTVALGEDLRERSQVVVFSYSGAGSAPMRFPLATLSEFSAGRWLPQEEINAAGLDLTEARSPDRLMPEGTAAMANAGQDVSVRIEGLVSEWLPLPQSPVRVEPIGEGGFEPGDWMWIEGSNTARAESQGTRRGDEYRAFALLNLADRWSREALADLPSESVVTYPDAASAPEAIRPYLDLPSDMPTTISETAAAITNGSSGRIEAAFALQDYFRGGEFIYDESAPYEPGMDTGDPFAVMAALLDNKRGYCVHFASTFAVMARSQGIPARVAVGYASFGEGEGRTEVRASELHAWPEIFVDGLGWMAFEPTPGGPGVTPGQSTEGETAPSPEESVPSAEPTPADEQEPTNTPGATSSGEDPADGTQADRSQDSGLPRGVLLMLVASLALLCVLGGPALARIARSRRRWRRIGQGESPATNAWREIEDTAADLGMEKALLRAHTGEAVLERLEETDMVVDAGAVTAARSILALANEERYATAPDSMRRHAGGGADGGAGEGEGSGEGADTPADGAARAPRDRQDIEGALGLVIGELRARATTSRRLRARLWPPSVVSAASRASRRTR
ncbi:transglutaminaseTgpA domain-containing protein [Actinomycetaceae bacterium L2_0104]